jgi:hypothetical protein
MAKFTSTEIHEIIGFDHVTKFRGIYKVYRGYFYRASITEHWMAEEVSIRLRKAGIAHTILKTGDHYAKFKGGAPIQKSSHLWVTFTVEG